MNLTADDCINYGVRLVNNPLYVISQIIHIFIGLGSMTMLFVMKKLIRKINYHQNAKVIVYAIVACVLIHALVMVVFEILQILHSSWWIDPCDIFIPMRTCLYVRVPLHACLICFVLLQLSLCVERTIATVWSQIYEKMHSYIGLIITLIAAASSIAYSSYIDIDRSDEPQASCLNNSRSSSARINAMNYTLVTINAITFVWVCILQVKNRSFLKRLNATLTNRYQLHQNMMSLKLLVSMGIVQFIFYAIFLATSIIRRSIITTFDVITYRIIASFGYAISYYTLALPILMTSLIVFNKRQREKTIKWVLNMNTVGSEGKDNYFHQYRKQW